jgi:hypothetical protein
MRLRIAKPFNDPDYIFELKHVAENEKARGRTGLSDHHRTYSPTSALIVLKEDVRVLVDCSGS